MAWTTPATYTDGAVLTGAQMNLIRDNLNETAPAKATTAGGIFVATGANAIAQRIPTTASVITNESTTSTTFAALTTPGPAVTVTTGTQAIVLISAQGANNTVSAAAYSSFAVSGATTTAASDDFAIYTVSSISNDAQGVSKAEFVSLTAGSNTFTMQYRASSGTAQYRRRKITVIPL